MPMAKQPLSLAYALLGFVMEQPAHGYDMYQRLYTRHPLGQIWRLKQSLFYALLMRLEDEHFLISDREIQHNKPARKRYEVTEAGRIMFQKWLTTPVGHGRDVRLELLAKLYFAQQQGADIAFMLIQQQEAQLETWLRQLEQQFSDHDAHSYEWLILQFRYGQLQAAGIWLKQCREWIAESSHTRP